MSKPTLKMRDLSPAEIQRVTTVSGGDVQTTSDKLGLRRIIREFRELALTWDSAVNCYAGPGIVVYLERDKHGLD